MLYELNDSTDRLAARFKFTSQDLIANRAGRMSAAQSIRAYLKVLLLLIIAALISIGFTFSAIALETWWFFIFFLFPIVFLVFSWLNWQAARAGVVGIAFEAISIRRDRDPGSFETCSYV